MRPGLWDGVLIISGEKPMESTYCDGGRPITQARMGVCSRYVVMREAGGALVSDSQCLDPDGASITIHAITAGDFDRAFTQDGRMTRTLAGKPPQVIVGHMTFRYVGPCPPGRQPKAPPAP
jgi:hypothetical protein